MSWLYSRALVAEYLEGTCSDGAPFAPSSGNPTPQAYLPPDKMTAFSRPSRFGMTFAPLTGVHGEELLTWFRAVFHARTSAPQEKAPGSTVSDPACGGKWRELSVRYDPDSRSWKTHRSLWDEALSACSLTLPKWGSMRDGVLSELLTLERRTAANDAGLWPTPNVPNGGRSCAHVTEWSESGKSAYHNGKKVQVGLEHAAKHWPTPTVCGNYNRKGASAQSGDGLATAVKTWPTPTVNDSKNCTLPPSQVKHDNIPGALLRDGEKAGGALNPTWVEWLMGWPLGWTDLKPLETGRCRNAQQRHGGF
ncbi:MAG: hypothetical protein Q8K06_09470 [Sulfuriferula sp.]|nr:hypothetical protein [Sulfuriferula sp.]MDP2026411.1 hypothetical protein [Sulfuriferula sp.]